MADNKKTADKPETNIKGYVRSTTDSLMDPEIIALSRASSLQSLNSTQSGKLKSTKARKNPYDKNSYVKSLSRETSVVNKGSNDKGKAKTHTTLP